MWGYRDGSCRGRPVALLFQVWTFGLGLGSWAPQGAPETSIRMTSHTSFVKEELSFHSKAGKLGASETGTVTDP